METDVGEEARGEEEDHRIKDFARDDETRGQKTIERVAPSK